MNNKLFKFSAIGVLALSSSAILFSCNKDNKTKTPHLTKISCENLNVIEPSKYEYGKDVDILIKPKKFVHLRDRTGEGFPLLKPFVGLGNPVYVTKAPLIEGVGYTYTPITEDKTSEDFETYKLHINGQFFTNSLVVSYNGNHTPSGQDISDPDVGCYEQTLYYNDTIVINENTTEKYNEKRISLYYDSIFKINKYSTYTVYYDIPATSCYSSIDVYGIKSGNDPKKIDGCFYTADYSNATVSVPTSEVINIDNGEGKFDSLRFDVTLNKSLVPVYSLRTDTNSSFDENYKYTDTRFETYENTPPIITKDGGKFDKTAVDQLENTMEDKVAFFHKIKKDSAAETEFNINAYYNGNLMDYLNPNAKEQEINAEFTDLLKYYKTYKVLKYEYEYKNPETGETVETAKLKGFKFTNEDATEYLIVFGSSNINELKKDYFNFNNFSIEYSAESSL